MPHESTKIVLGRGEVYFDRFLPGTRSGEGERYLGNTPSFRIQREVEKLERSTSYKGRRISLAGAVVSESHSITFTTDHVDDENLALWFGSRVPEDDDTGANQVTENFTVLQGRWYQLGKTISVQGTGQVAYVSVHRDGELVIMRNNYTLDVAHGRIEILRDAPDIPTGSLISVTFQVRPSNQVMLNGEPDGVYGAMRFISHNVGKVQNDFYLPFVRITPRGQTDLKSDQWQQWSFDAEALNLSPAHSQLYITRGAIAVGMPPDEQAIVDELGSLNSFPLWEDELHQVINFDWPPALIIPEIFIQGN